MSAALPANPRLDLLQPYPFERLRQLLATAAAARTGSRMQPIDLSIGEPRHATPPVVLDALALAQQGLSSYPTTTGKPALREAIARWLSVRHRTPVDAATQVLPVNGSREALFAFAQAILDPAENDAVVIAPNPFYQIYEGAALLAGARLFLLDQRPENGFGMDWEQVPETVWEKTRLVYVCSPGNPTGQVMALDEWRLLLTLADRWGFTIASDECYSEIYRDETAPPLGALAACHQLGRTDFRRVVVFSSLSKRSNVPGMRSGFVAGDARLLARFLRYRTYHGCAMSPMFQDASIAAWNDEHHVVDNRRLYRQKFDAVVPIIDDVQPIAVPPASFYLWLPVPGGDDEAFTARLHAEQNVLVLPGSYLARSTNQGWPVAKDETRQLPNAGRGFVRIALVAPLEPCIEGARRIAALIETLRG
ncbi:MAG: succinyldiaminopimelate transaminase [Lautropia sp.]|nr:succinyldiaminopimelate transaminase [Lautropia sp.]